MEKVLIIEDNDVYRTNAQQALALFEPIEIHLATNVADGLEKMKNNNYWVVLTDMNMPMKNGGENVETAGETIVTHCINEMIPAFVITAGFYEHGKYDRTEVWFDVKKYNERLFKKEKTFISIKENPENQILAFEGSKSKEIYQKIWKEILEKITPFCNSCFRYRKYILSNQK